MKGRTKKIKAAIAISKRVGELVLGIDGGGTKTRAIIANASEEILGEGISGPSNPLRVGVTEATTHIREAVDNACDGAGVMRKEILAAEIGLAGVGRQDMRERMHDAVSETLGIGPIEITTDAEIALFGATNGSQGLVVIAGTGSICCGVNAKGKRADSGGWGPIAADEGSGFWIARRGLQCVARATDGRGPVTMLSDAARDYFRANTAMDIAMAIYAPKMTHERLAGFARCVVEAAKQGDMVARTIIIEAGKELGDLAVAVIRQLDIQRERFQIAYVGGVFKAEDLVTKPMMENVHKIARKAFLAPPQMEPAIAATRMARLLLKPKLAIAV